MDERGMPLLLAYEAARHVGESNILRERPGKRPDMGDRSTKLPDTAIGGVRNALPGYGLQFSHAIADSLRADGYEQVEVRANVMASLNGRDYQPLIDPTVNLAEQPRTLAPAPWIVLLEEPLPPPP